MGQTTPPFDLDVLLGRAQQTKDEDVHIIEEPSDGLPAFSHLSEDLKFPMPLSPELIEGVLRCGHKMMLAGQSKAGKSFLLMELCVAIATGKRWLDFKCATGKVLYINMELSRESCADRFRKIIEAMKIPVDDLGNLSVWNLRGENVSLDKLVEGLNKRMEEKEYCAIIIDPIYKLQSGDENSAGDVGRFCNQLDAICTATGSSVIYAHHHSKGNQSNKNSMDRASGSGVFARDADAILDLMELRLQGQEPSDGRSAWQLEATLREFKPFAPKRIWFSYPIHYVAQHNELDNAVLLQSRNGNLAKSPKRKPRKTLDEAFSICKDESGSATVSKLMGYIGVTDRTIRNYVQASEGKFTLKGAVVTMVQKSS